MAKIIDIIQKLETIAPLETQEEWDNSGWQIKLDDQETEKVLIALNVTENIIEQAIKNNCKLIISHHPMIFGGLKTIKNKAIIKAIQNNIQVYSLHTNFDKSEIGTTQTLVNNLEKSLEIENKDQINEFAIKTKLKKAITANELVDILKRNLNLNFVKVAHAKNKIKTIAFCAGSGAEFISEIAFNKVDCYITGDIKYHSALDSKIMLIDIGHFESEIIALNSLKDAIKMPNLKIVIGKETPVFQTI